MAEACGIYRERREVNTEFWWGNLKEKDHWEVLGLYKRIILKWLLNNKL
jgi:hypothetical protein